MAQILPRTHRDLEHLARGQPEQLALEGSHPRQLRDTLHQIVPGCTLLVFLLHVGFCLP